MSGLELLGLAGMGISAVGSIASGVAASRAAEQDALNATAAGREERAAAQREAEQKRLEGQLANSRAQAVAASSGAGAGADAPTILKIMGDTAGQAELNAQVALAGGESRQRGYMQQARSRRAEGKASLLGGFMNAFGTMAQGGAQMYRDRKTYG